jgi:drug/metabolite transporter (DMT)-like permease
MGIAAPGDGSYGAVRVPEPLFASMLAIVVLGETFATRQLLGGMLVLTGVVLAAGRHVEPEAPPPL